MITAGLAQSVERLTAGQHVVGSIPGTGPIGSKKRYRLCPLSFTSRASETRARVNSRGMIFTRAGVSLALLSLRTNGGLLVVDPANGQTTMYNNNFKL